MLKIYRVLGKKGRITIPYEIRQRIGFRYNDVLSFTQQDDGSVLCLLYTSDAADEEDV